MLIKKNLICLYFSNSGYKRKNKHKLLVNNLGLKRVLHDNTEILAKVENTESSINILS